MPDEVSERQIEVIGERLTAIEHSLRGIGTLPKSPVSTSNFATPHASSSRSQSVPVSAFEGDVSFTSETLKASEVANTTAARVLQQHDDRTASEISKALNILKSSLKPHEALQVHETRLSHKEIGSGQDHELLPAAFVLAILRRIKGFPVL
jgi:hypothetical protein